MHPTITVAFILGRPAVDVAWVDAVLGTLKWAKNVGDYQSALANPAALTCPLCVSAGRPNCSELHGLETVMRSDIYHFAAARLKASTIIDSSNDLSWCRRYLGRSTIDARIIYLLAEGESLGPDVADLISFAPLSSYDPRKLRTAPDEHFPRVCKFLGGAWDSLAPAFWNLPRHGPGGAHSA